MDDSERSKEGKVDRRGMRSLSPFQARIQIQRTDHPETPRTLGYSNSRPVHLTYHSLRPNTIAFAPTETTERRKDGPPTPQWTIPPLDRAGPGRVAARIQQVSSDLLAIRPLQEHS